MMVVAWGLGEITCELLVDDNLGESLKRLGSPLFLVERWWAMCLREEHQVRVSGFLVSVFGFVRSRVLGLACGL